MTEKRNVPTRVSDQALEMVMRDVLDGMMELSLESSLSGRYRGFEILEITPEKESLSPGSLHKLPQKHNEPAEILPFPPPRKIAV